MASPRTDRNRVKRVLRWHERDGFVFWNGRRIIPISQAPRPPAPIKGRR